MIESNSYRMKCNDISTLYQINFHALFLFHREVNHSDLSKLMFAALLFLLHPAYAVFTISVSQVINFFSILALE